VKTIPPGVAEAGLLSEWEYAVEISRNSKSPMARNVAKAMVEEIERVGQRRNQQAIVIAKARVESNARFGPANPNWKRKGSIYDRLS